MDIEKLEEVLKNGPKYRLLQAKEAIFKNFISNWDEATFFTKELREELNKKCPLEIASDVLVSKESDSVKAKITLHDGYEIESVLMRHKDGRNTVCVSCQVGCPMNCEFCATGKMGLKRNLTAGEILEQVIFFDRYLKKGIPNQVGNDIRVTNVTFMGMGEPFLNYENVWTAVKFLNDPKGFNIGVRSISISTSGIVAGIKKLADEPLHVNLAISLHAPNDKLRSELMPVNKMHNLKELFEAIDSYIAKTKRKVMFEYVLIDGVNDTEECARELAKLMNKKLYFVNLILYNDTGIFKASKTKQVEKFKAILDKAEIHFTQRYRFGDDIKAACGQFATQKK
jgi:23S rRNA (adenine2503-C2)-methyltransferase